MGRREGRVADLLQCLPHRNDEGRPAKDALRKTKAVAPALCRPTGSANCTTSKGTAMSMVIPPARRVNPGVGDR